MSDVKWSISSYLSCKGPFYRLGRNPEHVDLAGDQSGSASPDPGRMWEERILTEHMDNLLPKKTPGMPKRDPSSATGLEIALEHQTTPVPSPCDCLVFFRFIILVTFPRMSKPDLIQGSSSVYRSGEAY